MSSDLRDGDFVRYEPESRWCKDGYAEAITNGQGDVILVDTYWVSDRTVVRPESFEVLFNVADFDRVETREEWERFDPADRQYVPVHGGYRSQWYVRKGAEPSRAQMIANAREAVEEAEREVRLAESFAEGRRADLDRLLAEGGAG